MQISSHHFLGLLSVNQMQYKGSEYLTTRKGWSFSSKLDTSEFESKKLKRLLKFDEIFYKEI